MKPHPIAEQVAKLLQQRKLRVVFVESCTGGMAAALLAQIPGISEWFCGSAVTYRIASKQQWLGVASETIEQYTAESQQVADALAIGALQITPEADLACAITGHLGPGVDPTIDGRIFVSIFEREKSAILHDLKDCPQPVSTKSFQLKSVDRVERQQAAAISMLNELQLVLTVARKTDSDG